MVEEMETKTVMCSHRRLSSQRCLRFNHQCVPLLCLIINQFVEINSTQNSALVCENKTCEC